MNRWIRRTVSGVSIASTLALLPAGAAFAQPAPAGEARHGPGQENGRHGRGGQHALLREAQKLNSLTPEQRTAIDQLVRARQAAEVPVRQANAQVLLQIAQQVEQATIDAQALAPSVGAEERAATEENAVERDTLSRLHALLTSAQRAQLVDHLQAQWRGRVDAGAGERHGGHPGRAWGEKLGLTPEQEAQVAANLRAAFHDKEATEEHGPKQARPLESFRGDSFDANALVRVERRGEREETFARAIMPVLTPAQRAMFASRLRAHATHESS